jgi:hypothetical protein
VNVRLLDALLKATAVCLLYGFLLRRTGARWRTVVLLVCGILAFTCCLSPPNVMMFPFNFGLILILGAACYVGCLPWNRRVALPTFAVIIALLVTVASWFAREAMALAFFVAFGSVLAFGFAYLVNHPTPREIVFLEPAGGSRR